MVNRREDCSKLLNKLCKEYTLEEIAVKCGVCASSVWKWREGRNVPMLAAKKLREIERALIV